MNLKARLIRKAIKWTPKFLILWVANIKLKGVAKLMDLSFDLDTRKAYVQTKLLGEAEVIEVLLEDFAVVSDGESYNLIIQHAQSNRPWLNNLFSRIVGRAWKIPVTPQLAPHIRLLSELLKPNQPHY